MFKNNISKDINWSFLFNLDLLNLNNSSCVEKKTKSLILFLKPGKCVFFLNKMAGVQPSKNDTKLTLEIRTKSVEQTLVPLVSQVRLTLIVYSL